MFKKAPNESRKIRYAVVGAGNIAQVAVLPAFENAAENSELVALVSGDPDKLAALGERYGVEERGGYDELEDVLKRSRADAVYIALPNTMHREYTERAAAAGVHVLCEKPMAMTEEDCEAMIRATKDRGVKLMIAYRLHFEEANLKAIEIARSGKLGQVRAFTSLFTQVVRPDDIRTRSDEGGGALFDLGVYCVNAARYLFREEPSEALALSLRLDEKRAKDVDETTSAILRFPSGAVAQFTVSQGLSSVSSFRIAGTEGDLRVEPAFDYTADIKHYLTVGGKTEEKTYKKRDQFAPELVYFSRCVLEDKEPEPSGLEGFADVRVMLAIQSSAASGRAEAIPPFERDQRPGMGQNIKKPPVEPPEPVKAPSPSEQ
ncbi:Gfo/Idh/MocA family oxidoreductase [Sorangium sp. So ce291]|uniref:Gfo/Idh/MocA family protein n=1 Tax=Sorangium sp. So ce291 TaxID=3133294 RepID=UPI003F648C1C